MNSKICEMRSKKPGATLKGLKTLIVLIILMPLIVSVVACDTNTPPAADATTSPALTSESTTTREPSSAPDSTSAPEPSSAPDSTSTPELTETPTTSPAPALGAPPFEPLLTNIFTADPSAHVFNGKLYIYGSHDQDKLFPSDNDGGAYNMIDYHVISMDNFNQAAVDHGVSFTVEDVKWAEKQLWAPDCAVKDGTYYFYFPAKDYEGIFRIGVATSDKPEGPFVPEANYIDGSFSIDPAVFTDDDGTSYMVFGGIWGGQLERWQTGEYDAGGFTPSGDIPALTPAMAVMSDDMLSYKTVPESIEILDENGDPISAKDENRRFFEGAWIHKYNDKYYLSYSTGTTHYLVYATSDNPMGPYTYQGLILDPVAGWTTHHSIVQFEGQWYLFYHDAQISGLDSQRNIRYAPLTYNEDGTIVPVKVTK
jgi:hypothetical protein